MSELLASRTIREREKDGTSRFLLLRLHKELKSASESQKEEQRELLRHLPLLAS